jgi:hypothetical protein
VFSDVLGRTLPNGWSFGLANERFVTNGKSYDNVGISPDVAVESLTPAARATGRDAGIERSARNSQAIKTREVGRGNGEPGCLLLAAACRFARRPRAGCSELPAAATQPPASSRVRALEFKELEHSGISNSRL